jgi:hypothetical protein
MENTDMQSTFEEKVNIEDLVLPSDPTCILNAETIDIKEEPLEQGSKNTVSIHESKTGILNMNTKDMKEEPLEQSSNTMSIHGSSKSRMLPTMPISVETTQSAENGHFKPFADKKKSVIQKHFKQQQKPNTVNSLNNCKTPSDDVPSDKSFSEKIKEIQQPYSKNTLPQNGSFMLGFNPNYTQQSHNSANNIVVVGSNPCYVPIATLSIKDLRLRGTSFIRSHASKHGLPNASRKQMKDVIELLKSHYEVVHQVSMLKDDFGYGPWTEIGTGGRKVTNSSLKNSSSSMNLGRFKVVVVFPN